MKKNLLEIEYNKILYYEDLMFNPDVDFKNLNIFVEEQSIQLRSSKSPSKYKKVKNIFKLKEIFDNLSLSIDIQRINELQRKLNDICINR